MTSPDATPALFRNLAARAEQLAEDIAAAEAALVADHPDEATRHASFRITDIVGLLTHRIVVELQVTASDLTRVRGRSNCGSDWGCCPEHGNTLTSSGGASWCTAPVCNRRWMHDRAGLPCSEPASTRMVDTNGAEALLCAGHTIDARHRMIGATFKDL